MYAQTTNKTSHLGLFGFGFHISTYESAIAYVVPLALREGQPRVRAAAPIGVVGQPDLQKREPLGTECQKKAPLGGVSSLGGNRYGIKDLNSKVSVYG